MTSRRALLLAVPVLAVAVSWGWWLGAERVRETRKELAELTARRETLDRECRRLAREVEALRREKEARVRAARESLDVLAPGEVMVVLPPPTPVSGDRAAGTERKD
jgi:cell division protein FtsB